MVFHGCNGLTSSRAVLESAERADPRGHAIHLGIALLWAAMQSITIAGEGIAWGLLVAIALLRLPRIHRAYRPVWRDRLWWVLVAWFGWSSLTVLWGPDARPAVASGIPDRWLITPLLLWPIMGRAWLLLGAFAVDGALHACIAIALSWDGSGWGSYDRFRALSNLSSAQWQFPVTMVVCALGFRWAGRPLRAL